jgi:hypothetical protein
MIFTELKSHANVEEWTEATCKEQHFITKELTGKEYKFWERRHIARYEFMNPTGPEAKDRHHLNNFFLTNGVKLKLKSSQKELETISLKDPSSPCITLESTKMALPLTPLTVEACPSSSSRDLDRLSNAGTKLP